MKNKIQFALLAAAALMFAGCALNKNIKTPHVVQGAGKVLQFGVVQDPVTGQYSLGYRSGFLGGMVVPVMAVVNPSNGAVTFVTPDAVMSYELGGRGTFFGNAASTVTFATGPNATQTLLGGMHLPINSPYWTNSAAGLSQTLPLAGVLTPTVGTTTTTTGTNGTATTTSTTVPIVIKP